MKNVLSSSSVYAPLSMVFTCPCSLIYAPPQYFHWLLHINLQDFHSYCCTDPAFPLQVMCHDWIYTPGNQEVYSNSILVTAYFLKTFSTLFFSFYVTNTTAQQQYTPTHSHSTVTPKEPQQQQQMKKKKRKERTLL